MPSSSLNHLLLSPKSEASAAPAPAPARLAYNPQRITQPDSVLKPITRLEIVQSQASINPLRTRPIGSAASHSAGGAVASASTAAKRESGVGDNKRLSNVEWIDSESPNKRQKGDTVTVASHYNARPNVDRLARNDSPIIGLKNFNNWTKSVLIAKFGRGANPGGPRSREGIKVLDIGCGKGGDLQKWAKAGVEEYIGIDLAEVSVEQARSRWTEMRGRRFNADFFALDCYERSIDEVLDPRSLQRPADVVSMQFCMHYAFESEAKARQMLSNVTRHLRVGGTFLGTIPDSVNLLARLDETHPDGPFEFGNEVYKVKFDYRDWDNPYGNRYTFFLQDAVEEVPEYVVYWDSFVDLAAEYGLELVFHADFQEIFMQEKEVRDFAELLTRMRVIDERGESAMTVDQWEAANLYIGFAFRKVEHREPKPKVEEVQ